MSRGKEKTPAVVLKQRINNALSHPGCTSVKEMAKIVNKGLSTVQRWISICGMRKEVNRKFKANKNLKKYYEDVENKKLEEKKSTHSCCEKSCDPSITNEDLNQALNTLKSQIDRQEKVESKVSSERMLETLMNIADILTVEIRNPKYQR